MRTRISEAKILDGKIKVDFKIEKMKMKISNIALLFILVFAVSCKEEVTESFSQNEGFVEYQYNYVLTVDSVVTAKKGYARVVLAHAAFAENTALADSLKQAGLRQIEVYLYSDNYDLTKSATDQELGSSMVQITLVDTLGNDMNKERVWPATYSIQSLNYLQTNKKKQGLGLTVNFNQMQDTITDALQYQYQFTADLGRSIRILDLGNNKFQIFSYGLANSLIYNVYYVGTIEKHENIITQ